MKKDARVTVRIPRDWRAYLLKWGKGKSLSIGARVAIEEKVDGKLEKLECAIMIVRNRYPTDIFPDDSDSIDARSARFARSICDAILEEYALTQRTDES